MFMCQTFNEADSVKCMCSRSNWRSSQSGRSAYSNAVDLTIRNGHDRIHYRSHPYLYLECAKGTRISLV